MRAAMKFEPLPDYRPLTVYKRLLRYSLPHWPVFLAATLGMTAAAGTEVGFTFGNILAPLMPFRSKVLVLNGVNMAVEELNKEGYRVKGKTVTFEVVAVDDRANAETGKEVAKQLVDAGVVAGLGWGLVAILVFAARALGGRPPAVALELPGPR